MLVLTLKTNRRAALIDTPANRFLGWVSLCERVTGHNQVMFGFDFPKTIQIIREELLSPEQVAEYDRQLGRR